MFIVTRTRTTAQNNDDGDVVAVTTVEGASIEKDVSLMAEQIRLGDHRMAGVRIFNMGVDDDGVPHLGTELGA